MMVNTVEARSAPRTGTPCTRSSELNRHRSGARVVRPSRRGMEGTTLMVFDGLPFPRTQSGGASMLPPTRVALLR